MDKQSPSYFTQLILCCVVHTTTTQRVYIPVCLSWNVPFHLELNNFINFGPDGRKYFQLKQTGIDTHWVVSYNIHHWGLSQLTVQAIKRAKTLTIVRAVVSVSHTYSRLELIPKHHFSCNSHIYITSRHVCILWYTKKQLRIWYRSFCCFLYTGQGTLQFWRPVRFVDVDLGNVNPI